MILYYKEVRKANVGPPGHKAATWEIIEIYFIPVH